MAVTINQNPIIVTSTSAAATTIVTQGLSITKIRWEAMGHATDNHVATVQDKNGAVKWQTTLESLGTVGELVNPIESDFNPPLFTDGIIVPTLGGGSLYIYIAEKPPFKTT
jgi:hypothetical protein